MCVVADDNNQWGAYFQKPSREVVLVPEAACRFSCGFVTKSVPPLMARLDLVEGIVRYVLLACMPRYSIVAAFAVRLGAAQRLNLTVGRCRWLDCTAKL